MAEKIGVPGENHRYVIRAANPFHTVQHIKCRKAGIEPTSRTDIGYRPVQLRCAEQLGHHVRESY
jgi:hypothetical protein